MRDRILVAVLSVVGVSASAWSLEIDDYNTLEDWSAAVGSYEFVDFTDGEPGTLVLDHYASIGLTTFQNDDFFSDILAFEDGGGVFGGFNDISVAIEFEQPITSFALEFPGGFSALFYLDGELLGESEFYLNGCCGFDDFVGLTLDTPFDAIQFGSPGGAYIDNIYFPTIVPAPAGLAVFAGLLVTRRRRRI